jgi:hypothetical protein
VTGSMRQVAAQIHAMPMVPRPRSTIFRVIAMAVLGGVIALVATELVATVAAVLGMNALHDVGVNTGPLAAVGGGAAGLGGAGTGTGPDPAGASGTTDPGAGAGKYPTLWTELGLRVEQMGAKLDQTVDLYTMRGTDPKTGRLMTPAEYLKQKAADEESYRRDHTGSNVDVVD